MVDEPTPAPAPAPEAAPAPAPELTPASPTPSLVGEAAPPAPEPKPGEKPSEPKPPLPGDPPFKFEDLKIPDGVKLEGESKEAFTKVMTEADPAKRAQAALDLFSAETKKFTDSVAKTYAETQTKWVEQVKADKEIGGENWAATSKTIGKALDTYGTPGVRAALNLTGAGNNPEVIRTIFNMAKALSEGQHVSGGPPAAGSGDKTLAELMYPTAQGA